MQKESRYQIRPIRPDEWLPDRCMAEAPFDPKTAVFKAGCASLNGFYTKDSRKRLENLYRAVLREVGCCGFVAWDYDRVVGYNNFFPREFAQTTRFYGWGKKDDKMPETLIHHCISLVRHPKYHRKGIGTSLIKHSLDWCRENGWQRFEVHLVLPDVPLGFVQEQKGCAGFWKRFGFEIIRSEPADSKTKKMYGVAVRYSMALDLNKWQGLV